MLRAVGSAILIAIAEARWRTVIAWAGAIAVTLALVTWTGAITVALVTVNWTIAVALIAGRWAFAVTLIAGRWAFAVTLVAGRWAFAVALVAGRWAFAVALIAGRWAGAVNRFPHWQLAFLWWGREIAWGWFTRDKVSWCGLTRARVSGERDRRRRNDGWWCGNRSGGRNRGGCDNTRDGRFDRLANDPFADHGPRGRGPLDAFGVGHNSYLNEMGKTRVMAWKKRHKGTKLGSNFVSPTHKRLGNKKNQHGNVGIGDATLACASG